ncbi:uncharacterized protein LOC18429091 isoform X2 [Amborella trichopoda]|uniref:SH2 domain-containing protein n=1 Tax=Amborella trichopoda TaxID=13333 RepID=W1P0D1_AMBTC|nr:uncharacterized protein LOC18429091 isoform X2 [Amborella trichopoda]ERN01016.1 hypothetical protein AMTR_s00002p00132230 [Amborella trichopoda]|eukprot:XP_006838447.1 uncharacterized protein LOC18429091 isoform X2 [Amborella trichopoda]
MPCEQALVEEDDEYVTLDKILINLQNPSSFTLCLWVYFLPPAPLSSIVIRQIHPDIEFDVPFLVLNSEKKLSLLPMLFLHNEALNPEATSWDDRPCASAEVACPLEKWVHIGCEVSRDAIRLHIDGVMVGEKFLSCSMENNIDQNKLSGITLSGINGGDNKLQGYAHYVKVIAAPSVTNHFVKNPPVELALDGSSCMSENHEVEESRDGVWSVVGGKASCRRNFALDVILLDALGRSVHKDMELCALLVYADNGMLVERSKGDPEAPLLTTFDGVEFPSADRPIKLLHGRASFKLKISQLSSKCDNRLFRVRFVSLSTPRYPFLEVHSRPIRCISRNRTIRLSSVSKKHNPKAMNQLDTAQSPGGNDDLLEPDQNLGSKLSPPLKRVKSGHKLSIKYGTDFASDNSCDGNRSHTLTTTDDGNVLRGNFEEKTRNHYGDTGDIESDSESDDDRNHGLRSADSGSPLSDMAVFRYCLEGMAERRAYLKEAISSMSDRNLADFAAHVSENTGCYHNGYQILIAKRLIQEGTQTWNLLSGNNHHVLWINAIPEIERQFMKISQSTSRSLSGLDKEFLRRIAGGCDILVHENFEKLWQWLYPVALAISKQPVKAAWESTSPKWIEGLITQEEAEAFIRGPHGLQKMGTFILRFPTSRNWPHPDAGSLVVSYVGADNALHHKLLSLDDRGTNGKSLPELLLAEPELSQLCRVGRNLAETVEDEI